MRKSREMGINMHTSLDLQKRNNKIINMKLIQMITSGEQTGVDENRSESKCFSAHLFVLF